MSDDEVNYLGIECLEEAVKTSSLHDLIVTVTQLDAVQRGFYVTQLMADVKAIDEEIYAMRGAIQEKLLLQNGLIAVIELDIGKMDPRHPLFGSAGKRS